MYNTHRERAGRSLLNSVFFVYSQFLVPVLIAYAILFAADAGRAATNMTPISVTGFNRDVVIENTAVGPPFTSYATEFNTNEGLAFYQAGLTSNGVPYTHGLPVSGQFTNPADGSVFQFQPYVASNVVDLASNGLTNGVLTLTTPATYSRIAVIANSGNGTSTGAAQLAVRFNDGSLFITNYFAPDWFNNTFNVALQGVERINLTAGATSGSPSNPRFYQTTINLYALAASNRPVSSLTFGMPPSTRSTGIYAVSGFASSSVTPAAVTNLQATGVTPVSAALNGQVTGTGGEPPLVTLYYGPTDGGTTAANWANSVVVGYQPGAFSQTISNLGSSTTYYFTASATNAAGIVWATPSQSFTTPILTLASVTNLPASNVQGTVATLNGEVLNGGGEIPTVTLYYGTNDGGANAASWSNSVAIGPQSGSFEQTVGGLAINTTYYFTASVSNDAGTTWAAPSLSFTTGASNSPARSVPVLTQHNDNNRSGDNLNETALNFSNVNTNQFGFLYARFADDQVYAQPLIATNVSVLGRGAHNLLIIVTVNDTVYAYDADDPTVIAPYWTNSFIHLPNIVPVSNGDESAIGACGGNYQDFNGHIGIVSTPVIDPVSGTIYLLARTKETSGGITTFVQRLHALDLTTGLDRSNSPVVISATYSGSGAGSSGGTLTFDSLRQNQRPALLLVNGIVYITWSSHCDNTPYHGWLMGYDAGTLQQVTKWVNTPNGNQGGLWMSGQGPAADTNGNIFLSTGNGTMDTTTNSDYSEAFLKLTNNNNGTISVASYFVPYDWSALNSGDLDLNTGGLLLVPGTSLAVSGGKAGTLYVVNRDKMGGLSPITADTNILQSWPLGGGEIHGGPVWWKSTNGTFMYVWADTGDYLRQYQLTNGGLFNPNFYARGTPTGGSGSPGGILSVSANGTNAGTGIIWASVNTTSDANQAVVPGTLHAFNANNVSQELWNSDMVPRDSLDKLAKFVPPTVANGKVYMATFFNQVNVYGLFPAPPLSISSSNNTVIITWPTNTSTGYVLQSSTNLASGSWNAVTGSVGVSNGVFEVTVPARGPTTFYRLKL